MSKFSKISQHLYYILNQRSLNNALYDYYNATNDGDENTLSKSKVRSMLVDIPPHYPIFIIIIDKTFECGRIYLDFFDLNDIKLV